VLTKGDANLETDGGWTAPDRILGKVVVTIPYAAVLQNFLRHPAVLGMMILLLVATSYRQWKQKNRESGETPGSNKEEIIHEQSV
jgi:signal peptidase